jgi:hypothetical protein
MNRHFSIWHKLKNTTLWHLGVALSALASARNIARHAEGSGVGRIFGKFTEQSMIDY